MSATSATARRVVRNLAHRKINWNDDVWKAAPIVQNVNKFRSWVATADSQAEKYAAPPGPVDFASAKEAVRDKELVEFMEAFYKSAEIPPETHEWDKEEKDFKLAHFEQVKEQATVYAELKEDTLKEIEFLKSTKTTEETTIHDLMCNNPTIHEEIEDEIERREWFKDLVATDK
mmetsp:Transcript_15613/g.39278  ORF Transcript_15613/g.39278 Transcript_15613/m.39278 type:complete len:174 (+) Transcript_15613:88-609(+)|eukprot:CAMPEP_0116101030 /NCGR_PEP_ID=MMETSP0327-20121206/12597_1 /TAXON_ID=44447 /ORGANISM="Pseudo-nitzschia delicatissima, Strain B596" /LENGTH=173 /DNA_ID=CAMNT_0003592973 /DNA_START=27 /DNA_END=548 /DNA_ORIENTATION=-